MLVGICFRRCSRGEASHGKGSCKKAANQLKRLFRAIKIREGDYKMLKKICSIMVAVVMMLTIMPAAATESNAGNLDFTVSGGVLTAYTGTAAEVVIPADMGITSIGKSVFQDREEITSVVVPEGITSIGDGAFWGCTSMKAITLPGSLKSIGRIAFGFCDSLTGINIPNGVTSIGSGAFGSCSSLPGMDLPDSLTRIGTGTFAYCSGFAEIIIPASVTQISDYAFQGCTSLSAVKFMGNAPQIGADVFAVTAENIKIYYLSRNTGFSDTFGGVAAQAFSGDSDKVNAFVTRLYEKILGRSAAPSEINYYADYLTAQLITGADAGRGFVFSSEFTGRKLSNSDYVEVLYQTFMGRASDTDGKVYWSSMLDEGVSRLYVFRGFVESVEFTDICNGYGINRGTVVLTDERDKNLNLTKFVYRLYDKALGRAADEDGLEYYAGEILAGRVTPVNAAQNFIFSDEFQNRNLSDEDYVKVLYTTFMGREFDQDGLDFHLARLASGIGREEILMGFAYSPEFNTIMNGFGL